MCLFLNVFVSQSMCFSINVFLNVFVSQSMCLFLNQCVCLVLKKKKKISYPAGDVAPALPTYDLNETLHIVKDWASSLYTIGKKRINEIIWNEEVA